MKRWQTIGLCAAGAAVVAGKQFYREASPAQLRWLLAPTAKLVSLVTRGNFQYEAGVGWIDRAQTFIIAPACAGLNFLLAAFLALAIGWSAQMTGAVVTSKRLAAAAALAYVATLAVNTVRIVLALVLHEQNVQMDHGEAHRMLGIVVYLAGLCALYTFVIRRPHAHR